MAPDPLQASENGRQFVTAVQGQDDPLDGDELKSGLGFKTLAHGRYIAYICYIMQAKTLQKLDAQIQRVKSQLLALGPMRPGTLSRQYRKPRERQGAFLQISYTPQMKNRPESVRPDQ